MAKRKYYVPRYGSTTHVDPDAVTPMAFGRLADYHAKVVANANNSTILPLSSGDLVEIVNPLSSCYKMIAQFLRRTPEGHNQLQIENGLVLSFANWELNT